MTDDELKRLLEASAAETRRHVDETAAETRRHVEESAAETRRHLDETAEETRRQFDEFRRHVDVRFEHLESRVDAVAESVAVVDEKLDREAESIREEMRRGFADTQAMIKFSHAELDRRVRTLEEGYRSLEEIITDLQARVDRLEGSTH